MGINERIGIVGKILSENIKQLKQAGFDLVLFYDDEEYAKNTQGSFSDSVKINFSSLKSIKESIENKNTNVSALVVVYEKYIYPRALLARALGLKGPSSESALAITDKYLQRKLYKKNAPHVTPNFKILKSTDDLKHIEKEIQFPAILKPTNLMKSLLVTKCENKRELKAAFLKNKLEILKVYKSEGIDREANFIVEEFLEGTAHSIELFVDNEGTVTTPGYVVDVTKANEIGINDNFEYVRILPSNLSRDKSSKVIQVAKDGIKAIGLTNSTAHVEIIYTKNGPKIIEINGRLGGYRDRMYRLSFGFELIESEIYLYLGKKIEFIPSKKAYTAVFELFPEKKGILIEIKKINEVKNLDSFVYLSFKRPPGSLLGLSKDGFRSSGVIVISNTKKEQFKRDFDFIKENVKVIVR